MSDPLSQVEKLEGEVNDLRGNMAHLETSVASIDARVTIISTQQSESAGKLDQLLARGTSVEATRGMIPISYVTWGIGAFISFSSVAVTMLVIASSVVLFAMNAASVQDGLKMKSNADKDELKFTAMSLRVDKNEEFIEQTRETRFRDSDHEDFMATQFRPLEEKVSALSVQQSANAVKVDTALQEIYDHQGMLGHPTRQTYELESLRRELDTLKNDKLHAQP